MPIVWGSHTVLLYRQSKISYKPTHTIHTQKRAEGGYCRLIFPIEKTYQVINKSLSYGCLEGIERRKEVEG